MDTFNTQILQKIAALHSNTTPEYSNMKVCVVYFKLFEAAGLTTSFSQLTSLILPALVAVATAAVAEMAPNLEARVRSYSLHELVPCLHPFP